MPHGRIGLRWGNMKLITTVSKKKEFFGYKKEINYNNLFKNNFIKI